mmetsp:Transcript_11099/g.27300  ORF Transcript_11099/g.27300 Transcript_11099/m.27300 type:complete len:454 (+) Transcript_11099:535-1896(+)
MVPKFLNRLLGLSGKVQRKLTDYFLSFVETEIKAAKSAGKYDVGIKTLVGNRVDFVSKPRSFCFGGVAGSHQSLEVYQVRVDQGINFETALEMYRNEPTQMKAAKKKCKIENGFYLQSQRGVDKVYMIIAAGDKALVIRPNVGVKVQSKNHITSRIRFGDYEPITEIEAKDAWEKEFDFADIPSSEEYQRGCQGRHNLRYVFSGSLIPILSQLLAGASDIESDDGRLFRVIRVETSNPKVQTDFPSTSTSLDANDENLDEPKEPSDIEAIGVGQGVAFAMKNLGSSVLLGKVHKKGHTKWIVRFSNGLKLKLNENQVKDARKLFDKEVASLVRVNMSKVDASSISETVTTTSSMAPRQPVLAEDDVAEKHEMLFEQHFQGKLPDTLVGIEFSKLEVSNYDMMVWESVLRDLARKLLQEGVPTVRQLSNLVENGSVAKVSAVENSAVETIVSCK